MLDIDETEVEEIETLPEETEDPKEEEEEEVPEDEDDNWHSLKEFDHDMDDAIYPGQG